MNKIKVFLVIFLMTIYNKNSLPEVYKQSQIYQRVHSNLLISSIKNKKCALIDIRDKKFYAENHIPYSINVRAYIVKANFFLKQKKNLIIIDEGWGNKSNIKECLRLKETGFASISILFGGINKWHSTGGKLEGTKTHALNLSDISPKDFISVRDSNYWIVINADHSKRIKTLMPESISLPFQPSKKQNFVNQMISLFKQKNLPYARILIVDSNGSLYDSIKPIGDIPDQCVVFYLKGGIEAYEKKLNMLDAIRKGRSIEAGGIKKVRKGCRHCQ